MSVSSARWVAWTGVVPAPRRDVPASLIGHPVLSSEARAAGLSRTVLHRCFIQMLRGVWWHGPLPHDVETWLRAGRLVAPRDAIVSHLSALHLHGVPIRPVLPLHFSTRTASRSTQDGVVVHRRRGLIWSDELGGLPVTSPERAFVDSATILGLRELVRVGDALVHGGKITLEALTAFCVRSHLDGVVRARRAVLLVREGVESFLETDVRLLLVFARLPVGSCNIDIRDDAGRFLARGDIVLEAYKVVVEYDGWHHERDARQRQKDHLRRERLELRAGS